MGACESPCLIEDMVMAPDEDDMAPAVTPDDDDMVPDVDIPVPVITADIAAFIIWAGISSFRSFILSLFRM
jgi:hypothetical protein